MIWMLDTDSVSFALRGEGRVAERLRSRVPSEVRVSSVSAAELWFEVERRRSRKLRKLVDTFLDAVGILPFDAKAAIRYGQIAASLLSKGKPIGILDTMLAAHAIASGCVLVTHNKMHFRQVSGIEIDDWY